MVLELFSTFLKHCDRIGSAYQCFHDPMNDFYIRNCVWTELNYNVPCPDFSPPTEFLENIFVNKIPVCPFPGCAFKKCGWYFKFTRIDTPCVGIRDCGPNRHSGTGMDCKFKLMPLHVCRYLLGLTYTEILYKECNAFWEIRCWHWRRTLLTRLISGSV